MLNKHYLSVQISQLEMFHKNLDHLPSCLKKFTLEEIFLKHKFKKKI